MKWRMERNANIVQSSSNMGMIQQAWKYISTYKLTLLIVVAIATAHDISSCTYFTGTGSGSSNAMAHNLLLQTFDEESTSF